MNFWHHLSKRFPRRTKSSEAQLYLTTAYRAVFTGSPDRAQQQAVLADLLAKSGFQQVTGAEASDTQLRQTEGKRELFAVIFGHLSLSETDLAGLQNAARHEVVAMEAD